MKYSFEFCRMSIANAVFQVSARSAMEAGVNALKQAGDHAFREQDCEYYNMNSKDLPPMTSNIDDLEKLDAELNERVYKVEVQRLGYRYAQIDTQGHSFEDADFSAFRMAGDVKFPNEKHAEYRVCHVE